MSLAHASGWCNIVHGHIGAEDFIKLRSALDRVEDRLWQRELGGVTARHRKGKLTDAKIDEFVLKRRYGPGEHLHQSWS